MSKNAAAKQNRKERREAQKKLLGQVIMPDQINTEHQNDIVHDVQSVVLGVPENPVPEVKQEENTDMSNAAHGSRTEAKPIEGQPQAAVSTAPTAPAKPEHRKLTIRDGLKVVQGAALLAIGVGAVGAVLIPSSMVGALIVAFSAALYAMVYGGELVYDTYRDWQDTPLPLQATAKA